MGNRKVNIKNKMFNKYKKLLARIKSIEEYLSISYSPSDSKDGYNKHIGEDYSIVKRVDRLEKQIKK